MHKIKLKIVELIYGYRCNLSCKGCSSGSNFITNNQYDPTMVSIYQSIENLSKYVEPESIDLIGGELFLYWDRIGLIVKKIREHYPTTIICLASNGLLLDKFKQPLLDICRTYHPCKIDITDHFTLFSEDVIAKKYHTKLNNFIKQLDANKLVETKQEINIDWLLNNKASVTSANYKKLSIIDETYIDKHSTVIHLSKRPEFKSSYFENADGTIKPFVTNDSNGSYSNGCGMPQCHALVNSKLYKCSWFSILPHLLEIKSQLDDPDWAKYLTYKPLDLTNTTIAELDQFYNTRDCAIDLCDMCSNNQNTIIKRTKYNVIPIVHNK